MSFEPTDGQKPAVFAYLTIGAFAFVVGSLVTLQFATLSGPAGIGDVAQMDRSTPQVSDEEVTRQQAPGLLAVSEQPTVLSETASTDATPTVALETATVVDAAALEKQAKIKEANDMVLQNNMRMLTEGVIAGLYDIQSPDGSTTQAGRIVLNSRNAGQTAAKIERMLEQAAASGDLVVPEELAQEDGSIDSRTLLFQLVQDALEEGDSEAVEAAREMRRRAFAASGAQTQETGGERFYVVERGDSLAYIALQFYGSTNQYQKIYSANQDILSSPDKIRIGQRLRIPS